MGDWLGNKNLRGSEFKSFKEAKKIVLSLNIKSQTSWRKFVKSGNKPDNIPSAPGVAYKKEWKGWGDWFGTNELSPSEKSKKYLPFNEAREEARKLAKKYNLKTFEDWTKAVKEGKIPKNIPLVPNRVYGKMKKGNSAL